MDAVRDATRRDAMTTRRRGDATRRRATGEGDATREAMMIRRQPTTIGSARERDARRRAARGRTRATTRRDGRANDRRGRGREDAGTDEEETTTTRGLERLFD